MRTVRVLACCLAAVSMASVFNARATQPYEDYSKHVEAAQNLTALNDGLMGDSVSLYNGATEFAATDISVPGNNALPVQLSRRFSIALKTGIVDSNYGGIGNWDIDVPYVNATWAGQSAWPSARCSVPSYPTVPAPLALSDVWHGYSVHLPGSGDRKLLTIPSATNFPKPTAGTFYWTSAQRDMVSCITMSAQSAISGQGFLLQTTDGLKYYFDTATTRGLDPIQYESNGLTTSAGRTQYYVLASKIEDRFGNTVNFTYNANGYPTSITSSDGRAIKLFYNGTRLDHASVNVGTTTTVRTWYYDYGTSGDNLNMLTAVTLPDGHVWQYSQIGTLVQNNEGWQHGRELRSPSARKWPNLLLYRDAPKWSDGEFFLYQQAASPFRHPHQHVRFAWRRPIQTDDAKLLRC